MGFPLALGVGKRYCYTSHNAQDTPNQNVQTKNLTDPNVNSTKAEKPVLEICISIYKQLLRLMLIEPILECEQSIMWILQEETFKIFKIYVVQNKTYFKKKEFNILPYKLINFHEMDMSESQRGRIVWILVWVQTVWVQGLVLPLTVWLQASNLNFYFLFSFSLKQR